MSLLEPAGTVTVPLATPASTGKLNTSGGTISGADILTTTMATAVPVTLAVMMSLASPLPGGLVPSDAEQAASSRTGTRAARAAPRRAVNIAESLQPSVRARRAVNIDRTA